MTDQTPDTATPATTPVVTGSDIFVKRAELLSTSNLQVFDRVVNTLVEREQQKRTDAVLSLMDKIANAEKELKKIKPDQVFLDASGKPSLETWTKDSLEKKKKAEEQLEKMKDALQDALTNNKWDKCIELSK
jgi:CO dehydrogenase/acetyl-CoA synthase beta subunit